MEESEKKTILDRKALKRMLNEHDPAAANPATDCYHCAEMISLEDRDLRAQFSIGQISDDDFVSKSELSRQRILNQHTAAVTKWP
jgi:hypothetical protein